jgi:predicted short-subunit dehydrogenase-like oxidoreductase (DUF2520 family)
MAIRYGIVGDGRVARHIAHYFDLLGLSLVDWSRRSAGNVSPSTALARCDVVLVLVSDAAIDEFITANDELREKTLIHFSGSLVTPAAKGMHPLTTFGADLSDRVTYESIPFVCEDGEPRFEDVFPELSNPHYTLAAGLKPLYHGLAVMAGNFTMLLWNKLFHTFEEQLQLPPSIAVPYLRQVAANLEKAPDTASTGPITRGDADTIRANLAALSGDPYHDVYAAFVKAAAPELLEGRS